MSGLPTHTSPINFVDPMSYIPERWLEMPSHLSWWDHATVLESREYNDTYSVRPALTTCLSLAWAEMKLIIAKIILNFDLELSDKNIEAWNDTKVWLLHEKKPYYVKIHARKQGKE